MNHRFVKITIEKAEYFKNQGNIAQALALLEDALLLSPDNAEICFQLLVILINASRYDDVRLALKAFPLELPEHSNALIRIGCLLLNKGLQLIALKVFTKAIVADDSNAWAYNYFGVCNAELGNPSVAYTALARALELRPDSAEFHNNQANLCVQLFRLSDAIRHYQRALELKPDFILACSNLGRSYRLYSDNRGYALIYKALEQNPASRAAVDVALFSLNYTEEDPLTIFKEHKRLPSAAYHAEQVNSFFPDKNKKAIRIGYVSADFKSHPVSTFFEPVLSHYDRNRFEIFCYSQVSNPDTVTEKLMGLGGIWRSIVTLSDQDVADQIRHDGIDILIDLSGYSDGNRLGVFILKPAPIQCSWLGYPNTTGLPQIDYRITDGVADPTGMTEHLYTETLIRLPRTFLCYLPGTTASPLPIPSEPGITFCCFNNLSKIPESLIAMWSSILKALPDARLLLKAAFLADFSICGIIWSRFEAQGVDPGRIGLRGFTATKQEHLELYGTCHIALDTYPYHGTTTTCEALWMGVPIISLAGTSHVSRVGTSILTAIGVPELIATSRDEYIALAVKLGRNSERIDFYRKTLRSRMQSSALMDGAGFVSDLEAAFLEILDQ
jgi:predicted O-linked N-acetylglucosamine transferase (SPINDLY family)